MVLLTLASAQFLMTLDSSVMNVSIATVAKDVGTTVTGIQTAITFYTLLMASLMITGGKLGQILGRKRAFAIGCIIYGCGSLITTLAGNLAVLMLGWSVLEGAGAALIMPAVVALVAGGQSRMAQLKVPGSAIGVEIIEYKDIDRKPAHPRFQDPGAANLSLRVRDLNAVAARAKKAGVHVLTLGGAPVTVLGGLSMFMQDDDGFVVELSQADTPGGGFETTAADVEKTVAAYRAFGLEPAAAGTFDDFNSTKALTDNAGTPGAAFRERRMPIKSAGSGPMASINFIEFKNIERKPLHTRVQDPGTAILQLNVSGLEDRKSVV